jgi:hypothetical protein
MISVAAILPGRAPSLFGTAFISSVSIIARQLGLQPSADSARLDDYVLMLAFGGKLQSMLGLGSATSSYLILRGDMF